uniref:Uncharacterized protein n=1 Tax=Amphimedon queenslandica TaxID=400682 RepID=A0A1X7V560_AMPQE
MRFEAKHSYFKSLAQQVKCFKNNEKTLADHHQSLTCYYSSRDSYINQDWSFGRVNANNATSKNKE